MNCKICGKPAVYKLIIPDMEIKGEVGFRDKGEVIIKKYEFCHKHLKDNGQG